MLKQACLLALGLAMSVSAAHAAFPEKEINMIVPWGAGGPTDIAIRAFAPLYEKELGQKVVIVNKPGAAGAIGTDFAQTRPSDGYTVIMSAETPATFRVMGTSKLSFDDFDILQMLVYSEKLVVVKADSPFKTMDDLAAAIKANPGKVRMSYTGTGASGHIQGLLLKDKAGLDVSMTPFGGGNECNMAVLGGQVDFTCANLGTVKDFIASGKMRPLAMFSSQRSAFTPDVPPITDALPTLAAYLPLEYSTCLMVKKDVPQEAKDALRAAAQKAAANPAWQQFCDTSFYVRQDAMTPEQAVQYWNGWASTVTWLLQDAGATKASPADFNIPRK